MDIRTLSQQQLASMSLQEACKAIQALYTPEEWARMAHTPAATFTAEQIEQAAEPAEIPVYQQGDRTYCQECKPRGSSQRSIFVTSSYDHFCAGCGHDFKEMAEQKAVSQLSGLFREPCRRCDVVHTYGRDRNNLPLCQGCAEEEASL